MRSIRPPVLAGLLASLAASHAASALPQFEATALTGHTVTEEKLIGQPTILIVTPSRAASGDTRRWVDALRENIDPSAVRVRDVLAIDLPFFMSERDALSRAREKIPDKYHDQTWLLAEPLLEKALDIPRGSADAYVLVLDSSGEIAAMVHGQPTRQRISEIQTAVRNLPATSGGPSR